jgi:hypothetical protein
MIRWLLWWMWVVLCALLWAGAGCLVVVPFIFWHLSDAHYHGPGEVFLDPFYLGVLLPTLAGAVVTTVLILRYWSGRGRG